MTSDHLKNGIEITPETSYKSNSDHAASRDVWINNEIGSDA
jgi:hypothetical protein